MDDVQAAGDTVAVMVPRRDIRPLWRVLHAEGYGREGDRRPAVREELAAIGHLIEALRPAIVEPREHVG